MKNSSPAQREGLVPPSHLSPAQSSVPNMPSFRQAMLALPLLTTILAHTGCIPETPEPPRTIADCDLSSWTLPDGQGKELTVTEALSYCEDVENFLERNPQCDADTEGSQGGIATVLSCGIGYTFKCDNPKLNTMVNKIYLQGGVCTPTFWEPI